MATDAEIRAAGLYAIPQQKYLQNPFKIPTNTPVEEEETESFGIPNTNAFTNSGGGGGGIQTLNPYSNSRSAPINSAAFRDPLNQKIMDQIRNEGMTIKGKNVPFSNRTYENQLNKYTDEEFMEAYPDMFNIKTNRGFYQNTVDKLKDMGGLVANKFSGLPGVEQGKSLINNIMDNTMVGRLAAARNPLNPKASNYNPALQGQIDYLKGMSVDGKMMIGKDPGTGLDKYGSDSVLSGQNVVSGFGTNDYMGQLEKNLERLEGYKNPGDKTKEMIEKTKQEMKDLEEEDDKNYNNRQKGLAEKIREQIKNKTIDVGFNIHNDDGDKPPPPPSNNNNDGGGGFDKAPGPDPTGSKERGFNMHGDGKMADGGRAGYFFGGRVNFKNGGLASIL